MKITKAWPTEEEDIRKGYAEAGWSISPLKRANDDEGDDSNPSPKQKPRRKAPGGDKSALNGERRKHGHQEGGRLRRRR